MKVSETEKERISSHYIEQLHKLGYKNTDGMSDRELKQKLALLRYLRIEDNGWF